MHKQCTSYMFAKADILIITFAIRTLASLNAKEGLNLLKSLHFESAPYKVLV